ncbi:hypothetical protein DFH06DRAFT_1123101 [Mycena polygramma]|nr:hypothetical protein DFH06DRAFT_1123101 [Mycena polygramma]
MTPDQVATVVDSIKALLADSDKISAWFTATSKCTNCCKYNLKPITCTPIPEKLSCSGCRTRKVTCDFKVSYLFEHAGVPFSMSLDEFKAILADMRQKRERESFIQIKREQTGLIGMDPNDEPPYDPDKWNPIKKYDYIANLDASALRNMVGVQEQQLRSLSLEWVVIVRLPREVSGDPYLQPEWFTDSFLKHLEEPEIVFFSAQKAHYRLMELCHHMKSRVLSRTPPADYSDDQQAVHDLCLLFEDKLSVMMEEMDVWARRRPVTAAVRRFGVEFCFSLAGRIISIRETSLALEEITLTTPELWVCFFATPAQDVDEMVTSIRRARGMPLSFMISFDSSLNHMEPPYPPRGPEDPVGVVRALRPFWAQCSALFVNAWDIEALDAIRHQALGLPTAPFLESLSIERRLGILDLSALTPVGPSLFLGPLSSLARARLSFFPFDLAQLSSFHNLRQLVLADFFLLDCPTWHQFTLLLTSAPRLSHLALRRFTCQDIPAGRVSSILLPNITHMDLAFYNRSSLAMVLVTLRMPNLHVLRVDLAVTQDMAIFAMCSFILAPVLRLTISGECTDVLLLAIIVKELSNVVEIDMPEAGNTLLSSLRVASAQRTISPSSPVLAAPMLAVLILGKTGYGPVVEYVRFRALASSTTLSVVSLFSDDAFADISDLRALKDMLTVVHASRRKSHLWRVSEFDYGSCY